MIACRFVDFPPLGVKLRVHKNRRSVRPNRLFDVEQVLPKWRYPPGRLFITKDAAEGQNYHRSNEKWSEPSSTRPDGRKLYPTGQNQTIFFIIDVLTFSATFPLEKFTLHFRAHSAPSPSNRLSSSLRQPGIWNNSFWWRHNACVKRPLPRICVRHRHHSTTVRHSISPVICAHGRAAGPPRLPSRNF